MDRSIETWGTLMKFQLIKIAKIEIRFYVVSLAIAVLLGTFFTAVDFGGGLGVNLIICLFIGSCMYLSVVIVFYGLKPAGEFKRVAVALTSLAAGSVIGLLLGSLIATRNLWQFLPPRMGALFIVIILSTITGFLFWYIVNSQRRISMAAAHIQKEKIKRLTIEKQVVESNLKVLQAQIEPHFLFNTLSNIITLLEVDAAKGKHMLEDLTAYLRITLSKTREETTTLGQEIEMIDSYLNIFKIRMGNRLDFEIDVPESLKKIPFPPMLLQPIVENAILHGLEPKIEGGNIWVKAALENNLLRLEIADSGLSFYNNQEWGIGLSNIKERLDALYDDRAKLLFEKNRPAGMSVIIEVPV